MKVKRIICVIVVAVIVLMAAPVTLICIGACASARFTDTYYGELAPMYDRLRNTDGKKIVIIGTSSVAFGVDSALIEEELRSEGYDYTVCNFGLYGALGSKIMLDLSEKCISDGDIVIFAPEPQEQVLSLYFSASDTWYALDDRFDLFFHLDWDDMGSMAGNLAGFVSEKMEYLRSGTYPQTSGVYASASFDDNCDMTAVRENNVMNKGVDSNNMITLDSSLFEDDFINYVNDFAQTIRKRGAEMYYSFSPMNSLAVTDASAETIDAYYSFIDESFCFDIMSNPADYIYDAGWFYDSNVHVNSAGQIMHSVNLLNDIKSILCCTTPTNIEIPDMPLIPDTDAPVTEGDNTDADFFIYEAIDGGYTITGVTDEGAQQSRLTIPVSYNGLAVTDYDAEAFNNLTSLESITIQTNITYLYNSSFSGCSSLKEIHIRQTDPTQISVGYRLLDGVPDDVEIYVNAAAYSAFCMNYTWSYYTAWLEKEW
ncbi:MAG: leucine-rich repeat domain-containing protein [Clostridia bacterium]|nr:leucine-rich repeat domain-containing protein [Clostridia bacterium]